MQSIMHNITYKLRYNTYPPNLQQVKKLIELTVPLLVVALSGSVNPCSENVGSHRIELFSWPSEKSFLTVGRHGDRVAMENSWPVTHRTLKTKCKVSLLFVLAINLIKLNAVDAIVLYLYRPIIRTWGEVRFIGRSAVGSESPGHRRYAYLDYEIIYC